MQSSVNQPFLEKRAKYARWGSFVGMGALFIGLITTNRSPLLAYLFLLIGLFGATLGSYMTSRYVREPRADQILGDALANLDRRYALYHYYLPSNHIVASHYGLTVLLPRPQEGEVRYRDERWHHKAGWRKVLQLFGEPGLGKPDQHLQHEIEWVKEWIDELMPDHDIPVNGAIVFTSPRVELKASRAPVPAITSADLADHMKRGLKGQPTLSTALQKELRRLLDEFTSAG